MDFLGCAERYPSGLPGQSPQCQVVLPEEHDVEMGCKPFETWQPQVIMDCNIDKPFESQLLYMVSHNKNR
jgi:hypothetical protein